MENRYDFVFFFDVKDGNPNGDPDSGNFPRVDPETQQGLVTDVALKRKIRDWVLFAKAEDTKYNIFVQTKSPLNRRIAEACEAASLPDFKKGDGWDTKAAKRRSQDDIAKLQSWLCEHYYDVRTFGAVMSTGPNAGQIRGPVQLTFGRSIDPIVTAEHTITRVTDVDKEEGEMGRKFTVPYGLYRTHGFVSAPLAEQTGFSNEDLELLWRVLEQMFEHDRSAARGQMSARGLLLFKHDDHLGNAPAHTLFERITIERVDTDKPARQFSDYRILLAGDAIDKAVAVGATKDLGNGVTMIRRI